MGSYYWLKLYHEILDDPKMGKLSDRLFRRVIEMFLLAGVKGEDGFLPSVSDIAWRLRLENKDLEEDLVGLQGVGILTKKKGQWFVVNFAKRQAAIPASERMRHCRERKRSESDGTSPELNAENYKGGYDPVTRAVTIRNTDIDIDKDEDEDSEKIREEDSSSSSISNDGKPLNELIKALSVVCILGETSELVLTAAGIIATEELGSPDDVMDWALDRWPALRSETAKRLKPWPIQVVDGLRALKSVQNRLNPFDDSDL